MAKIGIPNNISFDKLNNILIGWYRAGAGDKFVRYTDVADRTGIHKNIISRQNSFLNEAGFLTMEKQGYYQLTPLGLEYVRFLDIGLIKECKQPLRKLLSEWEVIEMLLDYVDINAPVSRDDLSKRVAILTEQQVDKSGVSTGINALTDMLLFSGLMIEGEKGIERPSEEDEASREGPYNIEVEGERSVAIPSVSPPLTFERREAGELNAQVLFRIDIDANMDVEKLREIISVIKEEIGGKVSVVAGYED